MNNRFYIKSRRQQRAIQALLEKPISVKDLGLVIGALNPRQIILELRHQGFQDVIETRRFTIIDQDGKKCRPGEYFIPLEFKSAVECFLEHACKPISKKFEQRNPNIQNKKEA